jgi:23S rRNA (cytosine1962-C5)-methyltransferase
MKVITPESTTNHRLLDSGDGFKLEQFGSNTIMRPDTNCVWKPTTTPDNWNRAVARYQKKGANWEWTQTKQFKEPWLFTFHLPATGNKEAVKFTCQLRMSQSKNIGIFPEQAAQWSWMTKLIQEVPYSPNVLNLFGYTGAASLCAASAGAQVCHVDASKPAINWAKENQKLSHLDNAPIRWILDDCTKFVMREIKRKEMYDGLIIDPPAFGRDHKGNVFEFEKRVYELLGLCKQVLKPQPLFVIFNGYSMGYSATVLKNLLHDFFPQAKINCGELHLIEHTGKRTMPCSIYARFSSLK